MSMNIRKIFTFENLNKIYSNKTNEKTKKTDQYKQNNMLTLALGLTATVAIAGIALYKSNNKSNMSIKMFKKKLRK